MLSRMAFILLLFLLVSTRGKTIYKDYKPEKYELEEAHYPENFTTLATLDEFVRLINEHKLNVSLIISEGKNYENGNLKEVTAMTMTFPVNSESTKTQTLKIEDFEKLVQVATKEKLIVAGSLSQVNNGTVIISNNIREVPISKAYKIFTGIKKGRTGFVFDDKDYAAQYTFLSPGSDGKNTTTRVFHGDVHVDVINSHNIKDDEIPKIKKAIIDAYFTFEPEWVPKAASLMIEKSCPDHKWEVAQIEGESYVDSEKWIHLKIVTEEYVIFTS